MYVDRSSNTKGSGARILLRNSTRDLMEHSFRFSFQASNNKAKYEALIAGLCMARRFRAMLLKNFSNSQLVVN